MKVEAAVTVVTPVRSINDDGFNDADLVLTPGDLVRVIHARKLVDDPTELVFSTYAMHGKVWITTDLPLTVLHVSREPMDTFVCCRHGLGWLKSEDLTGWE